MQHITDIYLFEHWNIRVHQTKTVQVVTYLGPSIQLIQEFIAEIDRTASYLIGTVTARTLSCLTSSKAKCM